uniref:Ciliary neurotrophic factor n=1 Tax=Neogobius melanostomus TaxID=47308 RepID=A0A8C6U863_9GOBI
MAEQQEHIPGDEPEQAGSGAGRTGSALAVARLLHRECTHLLQLFREKESFSKDYTPDGGRIVSLSADSESSTVEQVLLLHSALRQCLGLIHCVIAKEEEEWGELEGDYESMRKNVRQRLEYLLHTTKALMETDKTILEVTPDHQCTEEVDGLAGVFALKMWTYRVLLELVHWADHAAQTLHKLHSETGEENDN